MQLRDGLKGELINSSAGDRSTLLKDYILSHFEEFGDRVAIENKGVQVTYRELSDKVEHLSLALQSAGIVAGKVVGVSVTRSIEMISALLSIINVGAIYLPIDDSMPEERITHILQDSGVSALITNSKRLVSRLSNPSVKLINPLTLEVTPAEQSMCGELTHWNASLAYLLYTSGSTGTPKGVEVSQSALVNFLAAVGKLLAISSTDRVLFLSSISFDISLLEILLPLSRGGVVVVASDHGYSDPDALQDQILKDRVTVIQATPSGWSLLLHKNMKVEQGVRLLCGGERLSTKLAAKLIETGGEIWNMYGPTEATIWATAKKIICPKNITLGQPLDGVRLHLLNAAYVNGPGTAIRGELGIGGLGLALGYRNLESYTESKFTQLQVEPGEVINRIYKTGDIVEINTDGEYVFIGRNDRQIKNKGYRLELDEIECIIARDHLIEECAVTAEEQCDAGYRLTAFVSVSRRQNLPKSQIAAIMTSRIKSKLGLCLPIYMHPHEYEFVDTLPRNTAGKVDYARLKARHNGGGAPIPTLDTETQRVLLSIWQELLRVERIELQDSFMALGGDSMLSARLAVRIREMFSIRFAIANVYQCESFVRMAEVIDLMVSAK